MAAYAGHFIAQQFGLSNTEGIDWIELGIQVLLGALVIGAIGGVGRPSR